MRILYQYDKRAGVAQSVLCLTIDCTTGFRSTAEAKYFSSSLWVQTSSEAHPASYPMGPLPVAKARPGCDTDLSLSYSAEVK
jgi:hypothetical protein